MRIYYMLERGKPLRKVVYNVPFYAVVADWVEDHLPTVRFSVSVSGPSYEIGGLKSISIKFSYGVKPKKMPKRRQSTCANLAACSAKVR